MSYATDRELRYYRWCRRMDRRPTFVGYRYWIEMGEPDPPVDTLAGTALDHAVRKQMRLMFGEAI